MNLNNSVLGSKKSGFASLAATGLASIFILGLLGSAAIAAEKISNNPNYLEPGAKRFEELNPKDFDKSENINHEWLALKPGMEWIFDGVSTDDEGKKVPHRITFTVTDLIKVIGGVRTRMSYETDTVEGKVIEREVIFHAQDKVGNVWHFGQYTESYEEGDFVGGQAWVVDNPEGAKAGIMMPATPKVGSLSYSEGYAPHPFNWTDRGRVYKMGQKDKVPAGSYDNVLIIEEYDAKSKADAYQLKYYAPGVGNIRVHWRGKNAKEREELQLTKVHQLDAKGLLEVRGFAMELEKRALLYSVMPAAEVSP